MWAEKDSNLRTRERTDLQSVAFSHSAIYPYLKNKKLKAKFKTSNTANSFPSVFLFLRATCRNRTSDLLITNQLLYHLS